MMGFFLAGILIIMVIPSYLVDRHFYSPRVSFLVLFAIVILIGESGFFGLYSAQDKTFLLIFLGVFSFWVGASLIGSKNITLNTHTYSQRRINNPVNILLRKKVYVGMLITCIAMLIPSIVKVVLYLFSGGSIGGVYILAAQASHGEINQLSQTGILVLIEQFIAYPLLCTLVPVSIVEFFCSYKFRYLLVSIILTTIRVGVNARRTYFISFVLFLIVCSAIHSKDSVIAARLKRIRKKSKLIVIIITVSVIILFEYVTRQRVNVEGISSQFFLLRTFCNYLGGVPLYFEKSISRFSSSYTLGFSTLRGFFSPIFGVLNQIGFGHPKLYDAASDVLNGMATLVVRISPTKTFNSFASAFFQFYSDGGTLGIIVFSILYGCYSQLTFNRLRTGTKKDESRFVFFYGTILMLSFVNIGTVLAMNFWPLVIIDFLYYQEKEK